MDKFILAARAGGFVLYAYQRQGVYIIDLEGYGVEDVHIVDSVIGGMYQRNLTTAIAALPANERARMLHESLGHIAAAKMKFMLRQGHAAAWNLTPQDVDDAGIADCHACAVGKDSIIRHVFSHG